MSKIRMVIFRSYFNHPWYGITFDEEWIRYRADLYLKYTMPSIHRQSNSSCIPWLDCDADESLIPDDVLKRLKNAGVHVTFDGGKELKAWLAKVAEWIIEARLDSDDMYGPDVAQLMLDTDPRKSIMQFYGGYCWDSSLEQMTPWVHPSPPFYGIRYWKNDLELNRTKKLETTEGVIGHGAVKTMNPIKLPDGHFCVVKHGKNTDPLPTTSKKKLTSFEIKEARDRFRV